MWLSEQILALHQVEYIADIACTLHRVIGHVICKKTMVLQMCTGAVFSCAIMVNWADFLFPYSTIAANTPSQKHSWLLLAFAGGKMSKVSVTQVKYVKCQISISA